MGFNGRINRALHQLMAPPQDPAGSVGNVECGPVFLRLIDDLEIAVWIIDPDYRVVGINARAARLYGEDLVGRPCYTAAGIRSSVCESCAAAMVFGGLTSGRTQRWSRTCMGREIFIDQIAAPIRDDHGNLRGVMILIIDITRQKLLEKEILEHRKVLEEMLSNRSRELEEMRTVYHGLYERHRKGEALYRSLLNSSADAIAIYDLQGNVKYINASFSEIFGWKLGEIKGKPMPFMPKAEEAATMAEIRKVIDHGERLRSFPTKRYTKDGRLLDIIISASRYEDHTGKPIGMLVILKDVTRLKEMEMQLYQSQRMEAIGTLASGIAHDFNNLMMGMQGNISLLKFDLEDWGEHIEKLDNIEKHVHQGVGLTRQLLGLAKADKYEVQAADLNSLLEESMEMFGRTRKEIVIERRYQESVWTVEVDRGQIEQVLLNLFVNAWQAMPGGGRILLQTENVGADDQSIRLHNLVPGRYVKITVADTGPGIDPAIIGKIFDPFFTTKHHDRGTGLGLASAYRIISNHHGRICVESEPGQGTRFYIYLPASDRSRSIVAEEATLNAPQAGGETILLVDDETMVADVTGQLLEKLGYRILTAYSGEEALSIFQAQPSHIDLVVLDIVMPGMGGAETFERLRELNPRLNVLLASGYSLNGQTERLLTRGRCDFIQKPFDITTLSHKIRSVIEMVPTIH
jgi:two-component system cell cycle sensor histidine kinase/response regulator CckA